MDSKVSKVLKEGQRKVLQERLENELADTADLTHFFIDKIREEIQNYVNQDLFVLEAGDPSQVSILNQFLDPNYKEWKVSLLSFVAKFSCTNTKCYQVMWSSSRATMQLHYKFFQPNIYKIVVRGYRRICAKCLNKSDVEFEDQ